MESIEPKILLLGTDTPLLKECASQLERSGFSVDLLAPWNRDLDYLVSAKPHLILAELTKNGLDWRSLLGEVREAQTFTPVIFLTSLDAQSEAAEAIKEGAADFLFRPFGFKTLHFRITKALETRQFQNEYRNLQREIRFRRNLDYIVGASPRIRSLLEEIAKVAHTDLSVLITGETGTGKELVARTIHYNSRRAGHPFIVVNCSEISETLLENQFFGHVKGAYTGADSTTKGLLEEADGGTLFLDEIGDLSLLLQIKLVRVLESGEVRKVGGVETFHVNIRVLAATHKDLNVEISEGRFREDLFYRLNVFPIRVPPLRERTEDIPLLVNHIFRLHRDGLNKKLKGFSVSAIQKLMFYHWPGNVRELENHVRQAIINAAGPMVYRENVLFEDETRSVRFKSFKEAKQEFEKNYIANVLRITQGNVAEAARLAKKDRKDFYNVMRKHLIRSKAYREK